MLYSILNASISSGNTFPSPQRSDSLELERATTWRVLVAMVLFFIASEGVVQNRIERPGERPNLCWARHRARISAQAV